MKTRVINLTADEAAAFQRGATVLVREVKPQPPSVEEVKKLSGTDYGWMNCSDIGRPSEFRVVGPVWAVLRLAYQRFIKPPYQPGDLLIGREAWFCYDYIEHDDAMMKTKVVYRADGEEYRYKSKDDQWRSSAVMPSHFARVRRIVTAVSLKRCQDLTEGEVEAMKYDFRERNAKLWAENRFVWVANLRGEV